MGNGMEKPWQRRKNLIEWFEINLNFHIFLTSPMKTRSISNLTWYLLFGAFFVGVIVGIIPQADVLAVDSSTLLDPGSAPEGTVTSPLKDAVRGFLNYFLGFLGLLAVIFIVYAGVLMVTASGNEEQTNKAKKILLWAGAGILIVMLSYAIVRMVVGAGENVA